MSSAPGRRRWARLVVGGVTLALASSALVAFVSRDDPADGNYLQALAEEMPAVAPPDEGAGLPPVSVVSVDGPTRLGTRPQDQLIGWSEALADPLNIPRAALQAYGYAAATVRAENPSCGLAWTTLAAIGAAESNHGRHGGATLDRTGRPSEPIIGIPLDGRPGVKEILDTDGGELDGDDVYDRAVGPMQFLPQTWAEWGVDADGDGVADPQDIDDAALAAGNYLCDSGGDLTEPAGWWRAVLTYNESRAYATDILERAERYGQLSRDVLR
ncbi:lytic transglycosylase domain-containing protein [Actinoalloteichus spitiensis]|uniref:lytic transglycosylase domain-containing protein n=1 Tax=Actinoalloteichus spitiensis TaxID=252394 RepID=UPI0004752548|nr:lytic murein transglycosylase [Actinoalloteichus spitiensis]